MFMCLNLHSHFLRSKTMEKFYQRIKIKIVFNQNCLGFLKMMPQKDRNGKLLGGKTFVKHNLNPEPPKDKKMHSFF